MMTAKHDGCLRTQRALQRAIVAFFGSVVVLLLAIYLLAPSIYVQTLGQTATASDAHPLAANVFLAAILMFAAMLCIGVVRRWRWLFWLMLVAFLASILVIPAGILQLYGVIPIPQPAWYTVLRMAVSLVEVALGLWMLHVWRECGVWAEGRAA